MTWIGSCAFECCSQLTLTAPARLLRPDIGEDIKMLAKECGCGECDYSRLKDGWVCPSAFASESSVPIPQRAESAEKQ